MINEHSLIASNIMRWMRGEQPAPLQLNVFLTDMCNLNCKFCWQRNSNGILTDKSAEVSDVRLIELVDEGRDFGIQRWEFCGGGEPFMRLDILLKMLEKIKKNRMWTRVITNGTLFNEKIIKILIDLECDELIISLDGPDAATNDFLRPYKNKLQHSVFEKVVHSLQDIEILKRQAVKANPKVKIHSVLSKTNVKYVVDMVKLAVNCQVSGITFDLLQNLNPECEQFDLNDQETEQLLKTNIKNALDIAYASRLETNLMGFYPEQNSAKQVDIEVSSVKNDCPEFPLLKARCFEPWYKMYVHVHGQVAPCCAVAAFSDNVMSNSLKVLWLGKNFSDFRNNILTRNALPDICQNCIACFNIHSNTIRDYLHKLGKQENLYKNVLRYDALKTKNKNYMLNVCLVSREYPSETGWGGIGRYTYLTACGLAKEGHNVHVIAQTFKDDEYDYIQDGVHVHRIKHPEIFKVKKGFPEFGRRLEYSWRVYKKILELIKKYSIQIIEGPNFSAECFVYSLFKKTPLVTRVHTPYQEVIRNFNWKMTPDRRLGCFLEDELIRRSDSITCSTDIYAAKVKKKYKLKSEKLSVISLGIEIPKTVIRKEHTLEFTRDKKVLFLGRLEKRKGIHILMQAIPQILKEIPNVSFTIIGRDAFFQENESSFQSPANKNFKTEFWDKLPPNAKDRVHLLGNASSETLDEHYRSCDLFVAPSLHETFGYVYLEAMSYGVPVIGCKVGGVPEVIKDKGVGILIEPDDSKALAEAIIDVLKGKISFKDEKEIIEYLKDNFCLDKTITATISYYEKLIQGVKIRI